MGEAGDRGRAGPVYGTAMTGDIWVLAQLKDWRDAALGLLGEAMRLRERTGAEGRITALVLDQEPGEDLTALAGHGADRILPLVDPTGEGASLPHGLPGEALARHMARIAREERPSLLLLSQNPESEDLAPRVSALLEGPLVTRAVDLLPGDGVPRVVRPVSNGYLFEELTPRGEGPLIVSFLPSVLSPVAFDPGRRGALLPPSPPPPEAPGGPQVLTIRDAVSGETDLEEADCIVCVGRGAGGGEAFRGLQDLARSLGGEIAGSRPVIDAQRLPFERQIGQTGKDVSPRLLLVFGVSGANEFTVGMEKSQKVVAVNKDPQARIFRFADLSVVGDLHEIVPRLLAGLGEKGRPGGR